jgi:hypothetical protein
MQRLPLILVLSLGCIPISSDVTDIASGLEEARLYRCDDSVSGGPELCRAIGGLCYDVRIGPDQEPAPDTDKIRYDRTSACLVPCESSGLCPLNHQCQTRSAASDESLDVCVPLGFCRGDADCVEPKYGGHFGTSSCVFDDQPAICRAARESNCDKDSECTTLLGEGAECYLQTCQTTSANTDWNCEEKALFNGRCRHAAKDTVLNSLVSLEALGFIVCQDTDDDCASDRECVVLSGLDETRCAKLRPRAGCQEPETEWTEPGNDPSRFCLPFVACVPNGNSFGDDRAWCPGFKDESCTGPRPQMLINQPPCDEQNGCPDGSNCSAGICFVADPTGDAFDQYQTESIPGCKLVDLRGQ